MTFLAPGWIAIAAVASLVVTAIHLIAWQLPRTVVLPTARFVPDEPARRAARTLRLSDLALLALRVAVVMLGGLALARPSFNRAPQGSATVIAIEHGIDSTLLSQVPRTDRSVFVVFDTAARIYNTATSAFADTASPGSLSLSVGLVAAIREARMLQRDYANVGIVLASEFGRGIFDAATQGIRETWGDSIQLVRIARKRPAAPPAELELVDRESKVDDPIFAALRLAQANGLLSSQARVVRGAVLPDDSAWARRGRVLVVWPRAATGAADRVGGVHAGDFTALGHFVALGQGALGRAVAWWLDGEVAARESTLEAGCVRSIGFDVPDVGDFVLSPSFQHLATELVGPCGGASTFVAAPDSLVAALQRPPAARASAAPSSDPSSPNRLAALLLVAAMLLSLAEIDVRRQFTRLVGTGIRA